MTEQEDVPNQQNLGIRKPASIERSMERIEAHLNKLHDFVRTIDARLDALEFESDKRKAIDKAIAAKKGKQRRNKEWQDLDQEAPGVEVLAQNPGREALPRGGLLAGQPLRKRGAEPLLAEQ